MGASPTHGIKVYEGFPGIVPAKFRIKGKNMEHDLPSGATDAIDAQLRHLRIPK